MRLGKRVCKITINNESYVNAISTCAVKNLSLKPVPHPDPYKVSWIDSTSLPIKSRCLVPIQVQSYQEKIWCDVLPMGMSSIILGRPWLYDHDATLYEKSNSCAFIYLGKKIIINPSQPKDNKKKGTSGPKEKKSGLHLISAKDLDREVSRGSPIWMLAAKDSPDPTEPPQLEKIREVLEEFQDVFLDDLPSCLPPLRDIQHAIDLAPGSKLSNLPHYRLNPTEHTKLQK